MNYENEPIQWLKYTIETLLPLLIVAPRSAETFRGFELVVPFLDDLLLAEHW